MVSKNVATQLAKYCLLVVLASLVSPANAVELNFETTEGILIIVGIAVGGVLLLIAIVVFCCCLEKKDKNKNKQRTRVGAPSGASSEKSHVIASTQFVQQLQNPPGPVVARPNQHRQNSTIQAQPIFPPPSVQSQNVQFEYNAPLQIQTSFQQPASRPPSMDGRSSSYAINTPSTIKASSPSPTGLQHQESFRSNSQPPQQARPSSQYSSSPSPPGLRYEDSFSNVPKVPRIQTNSQQQPQVSPAGPKVTHQDSFNSPQRVPRLHTSFQPPKIQQEDSFHHHPNVPGIRVLPQAAFVRPNTQELGEQLPGQEIRASARKLPKHLYKNPFGFPEDDLEELSSRGSGLNQSRPTSSIHHTYANIGSAAQVQLPIRY